MALSEPKLKKLAAMSEARPASPIPQVPRLVLSEEFKARFPQDSENFERYAEEWEEFFKKQRTRG